MPAIAILALLISLLGGCASPRSVTKLPAYDAAIALVDYKSPKMPKIFARGEHTDAVVFELIPYCESEWTRDGGDLTTTARSGVSTLIYHMPDAVVCSEGRTQVTGVVTTHILFGVSSGGATTATPTAALGYREAPAVLPFQWDLGSTMVRKIHDRSKCGELIEGDTIASVNGIDVTDKQLAYSALAADWIRAKPGSKARVGWIRPGTGRMEGDVEMIANPRTYIAERDFTMPKLGELRWHQKENGPPYWHFLQFTDGDDGTGWVRHGPNH
jgi:hypothetical protein